MAWSSTFVDALSSRRRDVRYVLERVEVFEEPGSAWSVGSHAALGCSETRIGLQGVDVQGATLDPRGWSSTIGAWSVNVVGEIKHLLAAVTKGTIVALKVGFDGARVSEFQTVAIGQVRNLRGRAPVWTLDVLDFYSACRTRLTTDYSFVKLFGTTGFTATITNTAYDPASSTYVEVDDNLQFERESGGTGAIKITSSGGGDPFYVTYTGTTTSPYKFTGISTTDLYGTARVAAPIGSTVNEVAFLKGHPLDLARKLLCSGSGTGSYSTLPEHWGVAIPDHLVDHDDVDVWKTVVKVGSGSYEWEYVQEGSEADAYSFLSGLLAAAGLFLTVRQGLLTVRAGQATVGATPYHSGIEVTDAEIESVGEYEAWDAGHDPEYANCYAVGGTQSRVSTSSHAATLPFEQTLTYDVSDRVWSNEAAVLDEMLARLTESAKRVPERLSLRCAGLRLAQLAPGDVVDLTTKQAYSRRDGADGFDGRRALVTEVSPSWSGGTVTVGLLVYPETEDEFA